MCFTVHQKHTKTKVATKDIVCYKLSLEKVAGKKNEYYNLCHATTILQKNKLINAKSLGVIIKKLTVNNDRIEAGLHSHTSLKAAKKIEGVLLIST